jgi:predicted nucleotidyltransferase
MKTCFGSYFPYNLELWLTAFKYPKNFCRRHHIRRLGLFGSVLTDHFRPDSDIDVLVEFEEGHTPGLAFFGMEEELSSLMGRKVDLNTPGFLSRYFRSDIIHQMQVQYEI